MCSIIGNDGFLLPSMSMYRIARVRITVYQVGMWHYILKQTGSFGLTDTKPLLQPGWVLSNLFTESAVQSLLLNFF